MPFDKAARACQLGRCVAHTGDVFVFTPRDGAFVVEWFANPAPETAPGTGKLNPLIKTGRHKLTGPRAQFAEPARLPVVGESLTDSTGARYLIAEIPPDPLNPLLVLICTVTPAAPAS